MRHHPWKWLSLIAVLAVALITRLSGLGSKSLWLDEALSWRLQSFPVALMIERTGEPTTVHPPLYFALLKGWVSVFGDTEFALRSLSSVAGVLAVIGAYVLAKELLALWGHDAIQTEFAACLSSALLAISPFQIHLSRQVRGYSWGVLFLVISSCCLLRGLRDVRRCSWFFAAYSGLALAFCYTHNLAVFSIAAQGLFASCVLWRMDREHRPREITTAASVPAATASATPEVLRRQRWSALWAFVVIGVGYAPWLPHLWSQSETLRTSWNKVRTVDDHAREIYTAVLSCAESRPIDSEWAAWGATVFVALVMILVLIGGNKHGLFLGLAGLLPVALLLIYSAFSIRNVFGSRYLAFAQPMWLISVAILVSTFRDRVERLALGILTIGWSLYGLQSAGPIFSGNEGETLHDLSRYLIANAQADERVVAQTPFEFFKWNYYLRRGPRIVLAATQSDRQQLRGAALLRDEDLVTPAEFLQSAAAGVWFITSDSYDRSSVTELPLSEDWKRVEERLSPEEYYWEQPVKLTHFRRRSEIESPSNKQQSPDSQEQTP